MPSFIKIVQAIKKLNSISWARLNFRRRLILCTTLYRNLMQASDFGGTFDQLFFEFFYEMFTEDASLLFLYHGAKKCVRVHSWGPQLDDDESDITFHEKLLIMTLSLAYRNQTASSRWAWLDGWVCPSWWSWRSRRWWDARERWRYRPARCRRPWSRPGCGKLAWVRGQKETFGSD